MKNIASVLTFWRVCNRSVKFSSSTQLYKKKNDKYLRRKKTTQNGLPISFHDKVSEWKKLLEIEISEQHSKIKELMDAKTSWDIIESRGLCISHLRLTEDTIDAGLGRIITLSRTNISYLPRIMSDGSPITLSKITENGAIKKISEGYLSSISGLNVIIRISNKEVTVDDDSMYIILPSTNNGSIQNLIEILKDKKYYKGDSANLVNLAFRGAPMPSIHDRKSTNLSDTLNESQVAAVSAALNQKRNLLCIQGPPGTGKTHVIAEIVANLVIKKQKVIVSAPTHAAVRNALRATVKRLSSSFDNDTVNDLIAFGVERDKEFRNHPQYERIKSMVVQSSTKAQNNAINSLKMSMYKDVYHKRKVIFSTISSSFLQFLPRIKWTPDVIIVDEAAQCMEPTIWGPVLASLKCKKLILVGDPQQLPAVVLSQEGKDGGLNVSLMERLMKEFSNNNITVLLNEQYRMNEKIMNWSNDTFYNSRLIAANSAKTNLLSDIYENIPQLSPINKPILMINTDKQRDRSRESVREMSKFNKTEAQIIRDYVHRLVIDMKVNPSDIGIISPYYGQVCELQEVIPFKEVRISSVDGFQGQEMEVIIFCLVRDNHRGAIGFLNESRRLNVAITRAKRQFILVASSRSMKSDQTLKSLYSYIQNENSVYGPEIIQEFNNLSDF